MSPKTTGRMTSHDNPEIDDNVKTSSSGECYASIDKNSRWMICNLRKSKWVFDKNAQGPEREHVESTIVIQSGAHKHSWREAYACFNGFLRMLDSTLPVDQIGGCNSLANLLYR